MGTLDCVRADWVRPLQERLELGSGYAVLTTAPGIGQILATAAARFGWASYTGDRRLEGQAPATSDSP